MSTYDSRSDTLTHIRQVQRLLGRVIRDLSARQEAHDQSKLLPPEKDLFDEFTPKLAELTYGSPRYKSALAEMKPALDHHYAHNRHHPEHFANGIQGMTLLDVIEMLCDWTAATQRHNDSDILQSIEINQKRFGYSDELRAILTNTARLLRPEWRCFHCGAGGNIANFCSMCGGGCDDFDPAERERWK